MKRAAVAGLGVVIVASVFGHTVDPSEVLEYLNSQPVRNDCGVTRAIQVEGRSDLLLVEINSKWFRLPAERRRHLAREWRDLWRHSIRSRRVSIVDSQSRPVVHYLPDGSVTVVDEEKR